MRTLAKVVVHAVAGAALFACSTPFSSTAQSSDELATAGGASSATPPSHTPSPDRVKTSNVTCTDANKAQLIADMLTQPIKPPRYAAGLDLAGDDAWSGIVQADVEKAYCSGLWDGSDDASAKNPLTYYIWGSDGNTYPVEAGFDASHKLGLIAITQPYAGSVEITSRPGSPYGAHTYSMKIGAPITRDGEPFVIAWNHDAQNDSATELTDALVYSFAPELPAESTSCVTTKRCSIEIDAPTENDDGGAMIASHDLGFYIHIPDADVSAPVPGPSKVDYFYIFPKAAHLSNPEPGSN